MTRILRLHRKCTQSAAIVLAGDIKSLCSFTGFLQMVTYYRLTREEISATLSKASVLTDALHGALSLKKASLV